MQALERQRLFLTDVEVWREHYAPTLASWRQRLHANWEQIKARFGEPFCRMFDFYLAGAEAAFRQDTLVVFQLQLARRRETVPPTRDYIERWKDAKRLARTSPVTHAEISQPSSSREASPAAGRSVKGERSGPASPSRRG